MNETALKIKKLQIQGAGAIAEASLSYLNNLAGKKTLVSEKKFLAEVGKAIAELKGARPTEPLNYNCLNFIKTQLGLYHDSPLSKLRNVLKDSADYLIRKLDSEKSEMVLKGEGLIKNGQNIFTHCHSSAVEDILVSAKKSGKSFKVFNTETRPMFQGRITARNLIKAGIPVTMVADSAAAFLISSHSGRNLMMDLVLIGADAILPDGSIINKIGTFGIAQTAYDEKVPIYVIANLLKYDKGGVIPIEIRPSEEIWPGKPKGLKIINLAFDITPAKYITGLVCEFGIIKPFQARKLVFKHYPWIK